MRVTFATLQKFESPMEKRLLVRKQPSATLTATCVLFLLALPAAIPARAGDKNPTEAISNGTGKSSFPAASARGLDPAGRRARHLLSNLPLAFEPNQGQTDQRVRFLLRGNGYHLFLTPEGAVLRLRGGKPSANVPDSRSVLRLKLLGANSGVEMLGLEELPGKSHYFKGNDPAKWRTNIPHFRRVLARQVYPGIDLVYYGHGRELEFDFVVSPGADPSLIRLALENFELAGEKQESAIINPKSLSLDANGDVVIALESGDVRLRKPVIYQLGEGGQREFVHGGFVLRAAEPQNSVFELSFELASYDRSRPLVIDPVLSYSTYLGGSDIDSAKGIAIDSLGSAYIVGQTDSLDFPTEHPLQPNLGGGFDFPDDLFVSKLSADGSSLVYSTYLGGQAREIAGGIAVDVFGSAYVTGTTLSADYPSTQNAFQPACGTAATGDCDLTNERVFSDAVITKLNPLGSAIEYSSFYTASNVTASHETGLGIAVDANLFAYVTGSTSLSDNAFVIRIDGTGSSLVYNLQLGGTGNDQGFGIAADANGNAHVTGYTTSADFPVTALTALQPAFAGIADGFLARITPLGAVDYATYIGGTQVDQGNAVTVDRNGMTYVAGTTNSPAASLPFAIPGAPFQADCALNTLGDCEGDAFVTKFDTTQSGAASLLYFSYFGAENADAANGVAVDPTGNAYLTGSTKSLGLPTAGNPFQDEYGGGNTDAFVTKLDPTASNLVWSSFLGGAGAEIGYGIVVDRFENAYLAGETCSNDFPTRRAFQSTHAGNCDAFVSKVLVGPELSRSPSSLTFAAQAVGSTSLPQTVTITNIGDSNLDITTVATTGDFVQTNTCEGTSLAPDATCTISVTFTPTVTGSRSGTVRIDSNSPASPHFVNLSGIGTALSFSPTELTFPSTPVGESSASQTMTVTSGSSNPITIFGIDASGDFSQFNDCGNLLAPASTCQIQVTFSPTATGIRTGSIIITSDDPASPHTLLLTGHGTQPAVALSPVDLTFPDTLVGETSAPLAVTLTNSGNGTLQISGVTTTGDFEASSDCGASLAPGASCNLNVTFTPTAVGDRNGELLLSSNAPNTPHRVNLAGNGLPAPAVGLAPSSLSFGSQPVGSTSDAQTVVLTNTGSATLTVSGVAITGVNTGDFTATHGCTIPLAPGETCAVRVTFAPTAEGTRLADVSITSNAPGSPHRVSLSGTGVIAPFVTLSTLALSFPDTPVGETAGPLTVTLTNSGSATLIISSIATTGDFTKSDPCGASLAAGASCIISVRFSPTEGGNRYGTLVITTNAVGSPHVVNLAGNGLGEGPAEPTGDFALSASPPAVSINAGERATFALTLSPLFGFSGQVSLSCSGAPARATCSVTPSVLALDGTNPASATVTVTTTARTMAPHGPWPELPPPLRAPWLPAAFLIFAALALRVRRRAGWVLSAMLLAVTLWSACGAGGTEVRLPTGTPAGTVTLTLSGTSGALTRTTTVTLTVN